VKDLAKMSALAHKAKANAIYIVEDINLDVPKTKTFMNILNSLKVGEKKIMFVTPDYNDNVYVSSRNIPSVLTTLLSDVNTYDLVNSEAIVLTESAALIFGGAEEEATA
jgi:large subunit ribosomal protein L4